MTANIIDFPDSDLSIDSDDEQNGSAKKEFQVVVEKIERYMIDEQMTVSHVDPSTVDIFDVIVSGMSNKMKCLLHPNLNNLVYRGLIATKSFILVKDFDIHYKDTDLMPEKIMILKNIEVLEFQFSGNTQPNRIKVLKNNRKQLPLTTSRNYYLPFYNNEDFYGTNWKEVKRHPLKKVARNDVKSAINIQDLARSGGTARNPVCGTVIAKSKLKHFGKTNDKKGKYPYTFCMEIEQNGWTCCVSFWNNTCLSYFRRINVGDHVLVRNYRYKKRYTQRTNTVYKGEDSNVELSINPTNPEGTIESLQEDISTVLYRFKTSSVLNESPTQLDTILDVVGIIVFVGRWEREKKSTAAGICCEDFWMYRWVILNDFTSSFPVTLKLYTCSQPDVLNEVLVGDIFIASRMLNHFTIHNVERSPKFFFHLSTTKESQLYRVPSGWTMDAIERLPFVKYPAVLDVLKGSINEESMKNILEDGRTGGYFVYPPLPRTLEDYNALFTPESPLDIIPPHSIARLIESMHVYQSIRVCIQGNIAAVEVVTEHEVDCRQKSPIPKKRKSSRGKSRQKEEQVNESTDYPLHVVDPESIDNADQMKRIGEIDITEEVKRNFVGSCLDDENKSEQKSFLRILLTSLNKDVAILAKFLPNCDKRSITSKWKRSFLEVLRGLDVSDDYFKNTSALLKDIEILKPSNRFLFVLDLYYFGNNVLEVAVNRAYLLK